MKYRVKEDFTYEPSGRADAVGSSSTQFRKGEIYELEPYTGKCCKPGEMSLKTKIYPECNNGWVWKPKFMEEHFEKL